MDIEILSVSTDPSRFIDGRQIASVEYRIGEATILAKILRDAQGNITCKHPTAFRKGIWVDVVRYSNFKTWKKVEKQILTAFAEKCGSTEQIPDSSPADSRRDGD